MFFFPDEDQRDGSRGREAHGFPAVGGVGLGRRFGGRRIRFGIGRLRRNARFWRTATRLDLRRRRRRIERNGLGSGRLNGLGPAHFRRSLLRERKRSRRKYQRGLDQANGTPPAVHGICGNYFYDRDADKEVMMNDPQYLRAGTIIAKFSQAGAKVAYAPTKEEGWEHAHRLWPNAGLPGELAQILPTPEHFEQVTELVTMDSTRDAVVAGADPEDHLLQIREYADAGYDELYLANMGPHHQDMIEFYRDQVLPAFA